VCVSCSQSCGAQRTTTTYLLLVTDQEHHLWRKHKVLERDALGGLLHRDNDVSIALLLLQVLHKAVGRDLNEREQRFAGERDALERGVFLQFQRRDRELLRSEDFRRPAKPSDVGEVLEIRSNDANLRVRAQHAGSRRLWRIIRAAPHRGERFDLRTHLHVERGGHQRIF